jgi:hypothetical protein
LNVPGQGGLQDHQTSQKPLSYCSALLKDKRITRIAAAHNNIPIIVDHLRPINQKTLPFVKKRGKRTLNSNLETRSLT